MAYLVRSFRTNARIRSLTTGTFNRVVKDRIAFRLSGAPSVLDGLALRANPQARIRLSSKPYNHTLLPIPCQRQRPTEFPRDFHIGKRFGTRRAGELSSAQKQVPHRAFSPIRNDKAFGGGSEARNSMAFRFGHKRRRDSAQAFLGHAKAEDRKLRKERAFGGPCFEGTLQKPTSVSESSPVAGTT